MRKIRIVLLVAGAFTCMSVLASCASAPKPTEEAQEIIPIVQTKKDAPAYHSVRLSPQPSASFAGFDKNKDHVIVGREVSRRERRVARLDLNHDKKVTIMEFMKNPEMHAKKNKVKSFDKPGEEPVNPPVNTEGGFEHQLENADGGES